MGLLNRQPKEAHNGKQVSVVIISAACCVAGMKPFDDQAQLIVNRAVSELCIGARVQMISAVNAFFGGGEMRKIMAKLMSDAQSGQVGVPVIMVNGKAVSYGVPTLEDMKAALMATKTSEPEGARK